MVFEGVIVSMNCVLESAITLTKWNESFSGRGGSTILWSVLFTKQYIKMGYACQEKEHYQIGTIWSLQMGKEMRFVAFGRVHDYIKATFLTNPLLAR